VLGGFLGNICDFKTAAARLLHAPLAVREPLAAATVGPWAIESEAPRSPLYSCIGGDLHHFSRKEIWLP